MKFGIISVSMCLGLFIAGPVAADTINAHDSAGAPMAVDTASVSGCTIIFDKAGTPFELCRLEKVEVRPPSSTRSRPGHADTTQEDSSVVYTRVAD